MNDWFPIPGAIGYFADCSGNIKGPRCILTPTLLANGYLGVKVAGKGTTVHAAVAAAFHGPRPSKRHTVNHKNGQKTDNRPENLEWVTHTENMRHAIDVLGIKFGQRKKVRAAIPQGPLPGTVWRRIIVTGEAGDVLLECELRIPLGRARCDQFAEMRDGAQQLRMTNATAVGRLVAERIGKPPSVALLADMQREEKAES